MSVFSHLRGLFRSQGFPDENFLTEIVFGFLERYPAKFIAWLQAVDATEFPVDAVLSAATQYHSAESIEDKLPAKRPDLLLWLRAGEQQQVIFIESKVESSLSGQDQLQQYARILAKMPTDAAKTLLFVTKDYSPQNPEQVLESIPESERPGFVQARWHEFALFLTQQSDLENDTLTAELLDYMKERQLDSPTMFTPLDIAALTGFSHALAVMRAVLEGEVAEEFERLFGSIADSYDREVKVAKAGLYVHQIAPGKRRGTNVTVGFWFGGQGDDYPVLYGDVSFENKTRDKPAVIGALRNCATESKGRWLEEDLVPTASFGRIYHSVSVGQFLGHEDQVAAMRRHLIGLVTEIAAFKKKHAELA